MPKVFNKSRDVIPEDAVYVGRPSKWGNPFVAGKDGSRDEVCDKYHRWLVTQDIFSDLGELTGKDLVCWCTPKRCHADILLELANKKFFIYV